MQSTHTALRDHQDSHEKESLQREIESRDRIIDRLIYELLPSGYFAIGGGDVLLRAASKGYMRCPYKKANSKMISSE